METKKTFLGVFRNKYPLLYKFKFTILVPLLVVIILVLMSGYVKFEELLHVATTQTSFCNGTMSEYCPGVTPGMIFQASLRLLIAMTGMFSPALFWVVATNSPIQYLGFGSAFLTYLALLIGLASWGTVLDFIVIIIAKFLPKNKLR